MLRSTDRVSARSSAALQTLGDEDTHRVQPMVALTRDIAFRDVEPYALRTLEDRTRACLQAQRGERELERIGVRARLRYASNT